MTMNAKQAIRALLNETYALNAQRRWVVIGAVGEYKPDYGYWLIFNDQSSGWSEQLRRQNWQIPSLEALAKIKRDAGNIGKDFRNVWMDRLARSLVPHWVADDEWACPCGSGSQRMSAQQTTCRRCGQPRPEGAYVPEPESEGV